MNRIENALSNKNNLITFVTGGDPDVATTKELVLSMVKAGVSIVEIGIPFSDPVAEGPVIQAANERALAAGTTTDDIFDMVKDLRNETDIPIVFLTYINPIYTYGREKFFSRCKECMVDAVIVPDLPYEERSEIAEYCAKYDVKRISLIAPTSEDRIKMLASEAEGFIYAVSSLGVTGERHTFAANIEDMISKIKSVSKVPVAIGFGISDRESALRMWNLTDNVIIGSAIVRIVGEYGKDSPSHVYDYVRGILGE